MYKKRAHTLVRWVYQKILSSFLQYLTIKTNVFIFQTFKLHIWVKNLCIFDTWVLISKFHAFSFMCYLLNLKFRVYFDMKFIFWDFV